MGIHYNYKAKRGDRAMQKEQKRKDRLASKRLKRAPLTTHASSESNVARPKRIEMHDINKTVTLEDLTKPEN